MSIRLFGLGALSVGLVLMACSDDEGSSTSQNTTTTTTATTGSGGSGGSCEGDLTGQAGGTLVCMAQADDTPCIGCARMECCMELQGCLPDENCRCLLECFIANCDPVGCLNACGNSDPVNALIQCVQPNCPVCTM